MHQHTRRSVLGTALAVGAGALLPTGGTLAARRAKRVLVLGGTGFVGPHQVRALLDAGHAVTVFNRGTKAGMFGKNVEELTGDRGSNLDALKGRTWDAVIDESASSASAPQWVELSTGLLKDATEHYVFISSRAVYKDTSRVPMTSDAPLLTLENTPIPEGSRLPYGHAKAYAERAAESAMPGRVTLIRAGLIVGPGDETDRFTYWPVRIARGGEVLAPGDGSDRVQIIDVRDLAEFNTRVIERAIFGPFNAIGPDRGRRFDDFLRRIHRAVEGTGSYTWVDTDFLLEQGVKPYTELPAWQVSRGATIGWGQFDLRPEIKAGMKFRPLETTARDTLEWFESVPGADGTKLKNGLPPEREAELLAKWKARGAR
jgi:2'-hydroxyisoflavone reductase